MILLYADDTFIFAHLHVDLFRELKALNDYCSTNGLEVSRSKTNIMIYKSARWPRQIPENFRSCSGLLLDIASKTDFLGVKISSSTLGFTVLNSASLKAKNATDLAISILSKVIYDFWDAYNKLSKSVVASVHGVSATTILLKLHNVSFTKNYYRPAAWKAIKLRLTCFTKKLRSEDSTLVKICLHRTFNLAKGTQIVSRINWTSRLREFLTKCDNADLLNNLEPDIWESKIKQVLNRYQDIWRKKDFEASKQSTSG